MLKVTVIVCIIIGNIAVATEDSAFIDESEIPELQYLDDTVDPCDNFYDFTCGNFKNVHSIPDDEQLWDHFSILQKDIHDLIQEILESEREDDDPDSLQKAKVAYKSCVGTEYAEKLDVPETKLLRDLGGWPAIAAVRNSNEIFSWNEIANVTAIYGIQIFLTYTITPNLLNANENVIYFTEDTTVLSNLVRPMLNSGRYGELDPFDSEETPLPYRTFLVKVAKRLRDELGTFKSDEEIENEIDGTIEFMRAVAAGGIQGNGSTGSISTVTTLSDLQSWTDANFDKEELQLDWVDYFNRIFTLAGSNVTESTKIMQSGLTSKIYGLLNLIIQTDPAVLKNFVIAKVLTVTAPDSDEFMRQAYEEWYVQQQLELFSREKYCLRKILNFPDNIGLSMALTHEYQKYHFNVNYLQNAAEMVTDLQEAFLEVLEESDWMDEITKANATKKAQNMITLLAYPDFVEDPELLDKYYENLRVCGWDHFGNSQRLRAFKEAINFAEIGKERDRSLWTISPLYTNAFYNRQNNRMLFPIAMLNPVFFTGYVSVLDYGRIGAIIGHEITHGFDNSGRLYDSEGTLVTTNGVWSADTLIAFQNKTQCFVNQYSDYYIEEINAYVNGSTTLNENLADNGGLKDAYKAFTKLQSRRSPLKTTASYTAEQLFFIGFGTMWCSLETDSYLTALVNSSYAPARFRVNGAVSNLEEFSEAFGCPVGANMNPENKCTLW